MKKKIIFIAFISFLIDQVIKLIVSMKLVSLTVIKNLLKLVYVENKGVAFSMLENKNILIILISIILFLFVIYMLYTEYLKYKKDNSYLNITYGILIGGILGNLFDRVIRGYVIDYISLSFFGPIFNLADLLITIGVIMLLIDSFKNKNVL